MTESIIIFLWLFLIQVKARLDQNDSIYAPAIAYTNNNC